MNYPVLIIQVDRWIVVYLRGQKYIEAHELLPLQWIKLGIIIREMGINDISLIKKIYIDESEVTDEYILWSFPDKVEQLHNELVNVIKGVNNKAVSVVKDNTDESIN